MGLDIVNCDWFPCVESIFLMLSICYGIAAWLVDGSFVDEGAGF